MNHVLLLFTSGHVLYKSNLIHSSVHTEKKLLLALQRGVVLGERIDNSTYLVMEMRKFAKGILSNLLRWKCLVLEA